MQKFRQIGALSLLTLLMVKAMIVPAIFFNYELRKDYIIQNFCVNKDRPELKCDGMCYLAKQIKAAQQQDENEATATFVNKLLVLDCFPEVPQWSFDNNTWSYQDVVLLEKPQNINGEKILNAIFHPPQYIS
jgi:hypothetical protein